MPGGTWQLSYVLYDRLKPLQDKMQYLDNGLGLGWLINPQDQQVEIYRPKQPVEVVPPFWKDVLPGFVLQLS